MEHSSTFNAMPFEEQAFFGSNQAFFFPSMRDARQKTSGIENE